MPPKKSTTVKKDPEHPSYKDMITSAISTVSSPSPYSPKPFRPSIPIIAIFPLFFCPKHCHLRLVWNHQLISSSSKNATAHLAKQSRNTSKATTKPLDPTSIVKYSSPPGSSREITFSWWRDRWRGPQFKAAIKRGLDAGIFTSTAGHSGSLKLAKKVAGEKKPAAVISPHFLVKANLGRRRNPLQRNPLQRKLLHQRKLPNLKPLPNPRLQQNQKLRLNPLLPLPPPQPNPLLPNPPNPKLPRSAPPQVKHR